MSKVYSNEMDLIHVCNKIESKGIQIDRSFVEAGLKYENEKLKESKKDFEKNTGRAFTNSSKLFAEIFRSRGESYPLTDKFNPSFKKDFLEDLDTPTAKLINKIRYHDKRISTYWTSFLHFADHDNIIHPRLNQAGTVTGRFSSSNPNMQNMPKEDSDTDEKYLIRRAFIPRKDTSFYSIDYSQMEYCLMLDYAGEHALIAEVKDGADIHAATAKLLGITRFQAKTVNFAILYGSGAEKLAMMLGVTIDEAKKIKQMYFYKLPKVKILINTIMERGSDRGFIHNSFGRVYWLGNFNFSYKLPNWLIQGQGSDIIKKAMVDISKITDSIRLQVHDELILELTDEQATILPAVKEIMESVYTPFNGLGLKVNIEKSSKSLAKNDMEKYEGI